MLNFYHRFMVGWHSQHAEYLQNKLKKRVQKIKHHQRKAGLYL